MAEAWEAYYKIDPSVPADKREKIVESLRVIAATKDGLELMRAGAAMNDGKPLTITAFSGGSEVYGSVVNLDFEQASQINYRDNQTGRPPSLTGILVHEMYHKADKGRYAIDYVLIANDFPPEMRDLINRNAEALYLAFKHHEPERVPAKNDEERAVFNLIVSMMADAHKDPAEMSPELRAKLTAAGWLGADGAPRHETEATRLTDEFMRRNGCNEPIRSSYYANAFAGEARPDVTTAICRKVGLELMAMGVTMAATTPEPISVDGPTQQRGATTEVVHRR